MKQRMKEWLSLVMECKDTFKIIKVGNCSTGTSEGGMVYSPEGVSQTIMAGCHGYSCGNIVVEVKDNENTK